TPFSDYGAVWRAFCRKYLETLHPETALVVLGDARSNWRPPETEYLARIRERTGRLLWLNPAPRETWDTGDSIMSTFAPFCHYVGECRNLRQLEEAARRIASL
ncbi:MAG: VWA domain-containing protein, partial [Bryobacteraceae bacterium]|nr:VWA domain-containing protein [Bryobacteraceae bacterium]